MKNIVFILLLCALFGVCNAETVFSLTFNNSQAVFEPPQAVSAISGKQVVFNLRSASFNGTASYRFHAALASRFSPENFKGITVHLKLKFNRLDGSQSLISQAGGYAINCENGTIAGTIHPTPGVALGFPVDTRLRSGEVYDIFLGYVPKGRVETLLYDADGQFLAASKPWTTSHARYNFSDAPIVLGEGFQGELMAVTIYDQFLDRKHISEIIARSAKPLFDAHVKRPAPSGAEQGKYYYFNDFETQAGAGKWKTYGNPCTVNFDGTTTEAAFSGEKSYKLDVTFPKPGRYIWAFPLSPAAPFKDSAVSAYMMLGEESNAQVSLGISTQIIAGKSESGGFTKVAPALTTTHGKWQKMEYGNDPYTALATFAGSMADLGYVNFDPAYVDKSDLLACPENIIININVGKPGQRMVLYLDELAFGNPAKPKTSLPTNIFSETQKRIEQRILARAEAMESELSEARRQLRQISGNAKNQFVLSAIRQEMEQLDRLLQAARAGKINFDQSEPLLAQITDACKNLPRIDAALASKAALILYHVPNITSENFWILPQDVLIPGDVSNSLSVRACRGEYEPASLLIQPLQNIDHLTIAASDLVGADGRRISADHIDIKYVKVWYQAGGAGKSINYSNGEILTPELLVNDPELVRVDEQQKKDFLKLTFPNETRYVDISDRTKIDHKVYKNSEFPVKDAPQLQPVNLTKMHNQQLWITVHVPEDAVPGNYTGSIKLSADGGPLAKVKLGVEVLPFRLLPPYYTASIDYHGSLDKDGTISSWGKTHEQMLAELKDMRAHGLTHVQHYFEVTPESLKNVMALREEAGFTNDTLYLKGHRIYFLTDKAADIDKIRQQVRTIIDNAQKLGAKEVYLYGRDEETGKTLNLQRKAWEAARDEGAKIFVAGQRDNAEFMADIQDVHIKAGWPDDDVSAKMHAHDNKIFMYAGPMAGIEDPKIYRRNYGLIMYKHGYDGIADNAYQHTFGAIWNDFDHNIYRAHSFTYPTADGVIDTIAWEGYREAIDDVRYLTTLESVLKQAKARSGKTAKLETAVNDAEQFLSRIKNTRMVESTNPDQIRNQAIDLILALQ